MTKKLTLFIAALLITQALPIVAQAEDYEQRHNKMFEKHDTNGDGVISQDEFMSHAQERFNENDTNNDGAISQDEAQAVREKRKEKMKEWRAKRQERRENRTGNTAE